METELVQLQRSRHALPQTEAQTDLVTCSLCLRVLRGSTWVEAERVIREIRSYELDAPPRLLSAVCDVCAESIVTRRARGAELRAA